MKRTVCAVAAVTLLGFPSPVLAATPAMPAVDGTVDALLVDGHTGDVAGAPRSSLAHVRADGSVDPAFRADAAGLNGNTGEVDALALRDGKLYVGGDFDRLGGVAARGLGAVDAATGAVAWADDVHG